MPSSQKKKLKDIRQRQSSELFHYKYILPVPVSLVRAFAELSSFDPDSVAQAMLSAMTHSGTKERQSVDDSSSDSSSSQSSTFETSPSKWGQNSASKLTPMERESPNSHILKNDKTPRMGVEKSSLDDSPKDSDDHADSPIDKSWLPTLVTFSLSATYAAKRKLKMWYTQSLHLQTSQAGNHPLSKTFSALTRSHWTYSVQLWLHFRQIALITRKSLSTAQSH